MTLLSNLGKKTGARIDVSQLGRWRKGEQNGKHRQEGSGKVKREGSSSRRGERVRRKTRLVSRGRGQSRLISSEEDITGIEEGHVHSSEGYVDLRGDLGDWNDNSENDEDGGEDDGEKSGDDGPANSISENSGEAAGITPASLIKPQGGRRNPSRGCNDGKRYSDLSP
jgi:hypothetical protein